jgi:hypothetical protein
VSKRRKNEPDYQDDFEGGSMWPWLLGLGAAIGVGAVAVRVLRGPAEAPPAAPPRQLQGMAGGLAQAPEEPWGRDHNGILTVPLPAESAARTAQARRARPPALTAPQGVQGQDQEESFGGGAEDGRLGGEKF